jgi:transcriptional regulator with XRE-family HTH domain
VGRASIQKPRYLASKLLAIRRALPVSQNGLIQGLGLEDKLTQAEISAYELGKRVPPLLVLLRYARVFTVHVDDLIDDDIKLDR